MLIDDPIFLQNDGLLSVISGGRPNTHLQTGVYQSHHFGSSNYPGGNWDSGFSAYMEESEDEYWSRHGVCDSVDQILAHLPILQHPEREFTITVTPVLKRDQSARGGWRWHKWGPYIGTHEPQCEYLHDEEGIEQVLVFHVYEKLKR